MKFSRYYTFFCWALAGWVLSEPTFAMTLGRLRGAAVLGQPLAVTIPLQATGTEEARDLCVGADVYFGESMVEVSNVTARLEGGAGAAWIQVSVRKPVDEPIVTLYLKTGCQQPFMRKYVLLSEFSSEVQPPPLAAVGKERVQSLPSVAAAVVAPESSQTKSFAVAKRRTLVEPAANLVAVTQAASAVTMRASDSEKNAKTQEPSKTIPRKKKAIAVAGARLQLLPLELTQDWEPNLRLTDQLPALSVDADVQKRGQAAELWRAINATPEEILQEAGKRAAMEAELSSLVASSRANQAAIVELNTQLKAAHEQRVWNPVVYVLLALLAACGAGLVFVLFSRQALGGGRTPWWLGTPAGGEPVAGQWRNGQDIEHLHATTEPKASSEAVQAPALEPTAIDIPLSDSVLPTLSGEAVHQSATDSRPMDFVHSNLGALRAINTHEMVDARQQADFFVALGQHDEAVGVLYSALSHSTESNPHIYLDLIALLYKLSRKDDYEKVRQTFNALYTCHIPAYAEYSSAGHNLLEYPGLLMPLVPLWPKPVAIEYVVRCMVRDDTDSAHCGIDRQAFEDLLLLHAILGMVVESPVLSDALQPSPTRTLPALTSPPQPFLVPQNFSSLGVDLDLSGTH